MSRHDKPRLSHSWQSDKQFNECSSSSFSWDEIDANIARDKADKAAKEARIQENKEKDKYIRAAEIQRKNDEQILLQGVQFIDNHVYIDEFGQKYRRMSGGRFWTLPSGRSKPRSRSPVAKSSTPIIYCPSSYYERREFPPAGGM